MKQTIRESTIIRGFATLAAATGCLLLGSCVSTTITPPPAGSAVIDAAPDPKHRDRVEGIELVAINGRSVKGTRCVIEPGLNTIKTRFRWPQGQDQQVQLRFYATPDTIYFIYYDVYPPSTELTDSAAGRIMDSLGETTPISPPSGPALVFIHKSGQIFRRSREEVKIIENNPAHVRSGRLNCGCVPERPHA